MAITHCEDDVGATIKVAAIYATAFFLTMFANLDYLDGSFSARNRPGGILNLVADFYFLHNLPAYFV